MPETERAKYYDIISDPAKRLAHEGAFLLKLLAAAPGRRVADMACGTGVQAEFLAGHAAEVVARDIDPEMIACARATRPHEGVTYEVADMLRAGGGPFDLAIVMGNSISMLASLDDAALAIVRMKEMLSPRGVGLVHVVNYARMAGQAATQKVARKSVGGDEIVIVKDMVAAAGAGALVSFSYFQRTAGSWRCWASQAVLLDVRRDFLRKSAGDAALLVEAEYGDYDGSAFDEEKSTDLLVVLRNTAG